MEAAFLWESGFSSHHLKLHGKNSVLSYPVPTCSFSLGSKRLYQVKKLVHSLSKNGKLATLRHRHDSESFLDHF